MPHPKYVLPPTLNDANVSLAATLALRASLSPDQVAFTMLDGQVQERLSITYTQLHLEACRLAHRLLAGVSGKAAPVLIACKSEEAFITSIYGCLFAGVTAVPASLPAMRRSRHERLGSILAQSGAGLILTDDLTIEQELLQAVSSVTDGTPCQTLLIAPTFQASPIPEVDLPGLNASADVPAFVQFTSGSTTASRGAVITHRNILANMRTMARALRIAPGQVSVNWCPLYHDMGLIGNVFLAVALGTSNYMLPPLLFLQRPVRWLQAISKYRAHISGGPNFAYEECLARISEDDAAPLDLSSWRIALNGAEPVRAATLEKFARRFEANGFRSEAMLPCYGLAENTLWVSGREVGSGTEVLLADATALAKQKLVVAVSDAVPSVSLVSCGRVGSEVTVAIVDPSTYRPLLDGAVGEIWVQGDSVARGYWRSPEATDAVFGARLAEGNDPHARPWLRTGDLGARLRGDLFVCGRLKELMIVRGRNYYPQDIEHAAQASDWRVVRAWRSRWSKKVRSMSFLSRNYDEKPTAKAFQRMTRNE